MFNGQSISQELTVNVILIGIQMRWPHANTFPSVSEWPSEIFQYPGGRLNKKDGLTRYGDSHVKDKTS